MSQQALALVASTDFSKLGDKVFLQRSSFLLGSASWILRYLLPVLFLSVGDL